jgi:hypothetical protein
MLNSAVVSAWLWVHIGVLLVIVGYATCGHAMLPRAVESGRRRLERAPVRTALKGLAISVPWVGVAIVLMNLPNGALKFAGVLLGLSWLAIALVGTSAVALQVGGRGESGPARWTHVARGGAFVALTWMLPVLGWFVVMPLTLACGLGSLIGRAPTTQPSDTAALPTGAPAAIT